MHALLRKEFREVCSHCKKLRRVDLLECEHCESEWDLPLTEGIEVVGEAPVPMCIP